MTEEEKKAEGDQAAEKEAGSPESKKNKISRMSLSEVEKAISETNKKMGGLHSRYARALVARKDFLMRYQP